MRVYLRIDLEPDEGEVLCECDEKVRICPEKIEIILGYCEICQCPVAMQITDLAVVKREQ